MSIREAGPQDAEAIAALVNRAYEVEMFFVAGDRTSAERVRSALEAGTFLVDEDPAGEVAACVHVSMDGTRAHFGMLAVDPVRQGRGRGRALIAEAERRARTQGATALDIEVVNLRTDLVVFYERLGYRAVGTRPYEHRPVRQPCHFICMTKPLVERP
jgi:N-acetylglutamate synthase-like GNAT family acetyltransferase